MRRSIMQGRRYTKAVHDVVQNFYSIRLPHSSYCSYKACMQQGITAATLVGYMLRCASHANLSRSTVLSHHLTYWTGHRMYFRGS